MANGSLPKTEKGLQAYIERVRAPPARQWLALGGGLTVCFEPSGAKTFQARLRRQGEANPRRIRIGAFPALSLADARRKLSEMKAIAREGRDPALEHRRARGRVRAVRTLGDLVAEYLKRREGSIAAKTLKLETELLGGVLVPALGGRLLSDLAPIDFGAVLAGYVDRLRKEGRSNGTNANKLLAVARRMFKKARGWGLVDMVDPTAGLMPPAKEKPRDRILFDGKVLVGPNSELNEIGRLVGALTADPSTSSAIASTRAAVLLVLMLGFRALEVCALEWEAINLNREPATVTVTKSKTKAGLRELPLPQAAMELLKGLRAARKGSARYTFPAENRAWRAAHLHPESLSRAFARTCEKLGIRGVTLHDLRRTCLSGLIELGHESVAERIAGHAPRHVLGRHYDRSMRLQAMTAALEAWARAIDAARKESVAALGQPQ
jgi:integrase